MKFYIPNTIPLSFKYIVPNSNGAYYDLYAVNVLRPGQTYTYYRFYNNLDCSLYTTHTRNITGVYETYLNTITVQPTWDYWARPDYPKIVSTSFILILGIIVLFNVITSLIKKGGLFSGLL